MKPDIHPQYRDVVFRDVSADFNFITRSTAQTKDVITWEDGKEYPLVKVEHRGPRREVPEEVRGQLLRQEV